MAGVGGTAAGTLTFRHRPWFIRLLGIGSTSTPAYRLSSVLLNSLPNGEVGVDAAWHAHRTALQRAPLESARHAGPEHAGAQWLQSFLHLEIALRVAQRIAKDSQLPLIDATRAPEALVSTVKATAYDVKSQGAISLASQQEAGLISLSEDEQSEEQGLVTVEQTAEGSPEIASAIRPKRVRVTRNGDSSEIRFFSLSLRTIVMSLVTTLLLGGVWTVGRCFGSTQWVRQPHDGIALWRLPILQSR